MNTQQMRERRTALEQQLRDAQVEADATSGGMMTEEQQAAFDKVKAALDELEAALDRRALIDDFDRRSAGQPVNDPQFGAFAAGISITDGIAASLGENTRGAGMAREASQEIARKRGRNPQGIYLSMGARSATERRAVITSGAQGTPPIGAPLIPTIVQGDALIDVLRANLATTELGTTFLTDLRGNQVIPRVSRGTSVGWFAENAPIPDTDVAFDGVGLSVKHVGAITEYSRNMLLNSTPDIETLLRNDLMRALAVEIDRAALTGTGDGIQPRGILNTPGVKSLPMGNGLAWPGVLALVAALDNANVSLNSPGFIGSGAIRAKAMATLSAPGVASQFVMMTPDSLAGYRYVATNLVPVTPATTGANAAPALSTLIFGSWENLLVGVWDALDLTTNPYGESAYRRGNVQIRIIADLDVAVRHPEAFAFAADVAA